MSAARGRDPVRIGAGTPPPAAPDRRQPGAQPRRRREPVRVEIFRTIGVGESNLRTILGNELDAIDQWAVSYIPSRIAVDVVLTAKTGGVDETLLDEPEETLRGVLDFLFSTVKLHRVSASVDPRNERSIALLERIGMRREAHFRQSLWFKGEWVDDIVYGILASEWCDSA